MSKNNTVAQTLLLPIDACLHEIFHQVASRNPDGIALVQGEKKMTFQELNERSNKLAHHLRTYGIQEGDLVAFCMDRSFEMMVSIFGILKAGGAYVPIDVDYPNERLSFLVKDANAKILLTQHFMLDSLPDVESHTICVDDDFEMMDSIYDGAKGPKVHVSREDLAYCIYTSGSTGKPKGCMLTHDNIINQLEGQQDIAPTPIDKCLLTCSISFDVSVLTIFWTLLQGSTLVLPFQGEEKDMNRLADIIFDNKISHLLTLPSLYTLLLEQAKPNKLQSLQLINVSGEVCPTSLAQKHEKLIPKAQLYNLYGPTEAAVNCTFFKIPSGFSEAKVPIGIPILNYEMFILDDGLKEVKKGETGEIYIGGSKSVVGKGYWNRPELTTERFIENPHKKRRGGAILYRTGDLGKWMPDGNIEFLGRVDFQVKFRGFRIELGEIEVAIGNHGAVRETVVVLKNQHEINEQRLIAYLVLDPNRQVNVTQLRNYLEQCLPEYMIPSGFVFLDKMPLTTNGKFDRKALPEPPKDRPQLAESYEAPDSELEKYLTKIWEDLLEVNPIGRNDKFFELGGNSIQAAKFIGDLQQKMNTSIFITTIFDNPTIAEYAAMLENVYDFGNALLEKEERISAIDSPKEEEPQEEIIETIKWETLLPSPSTIKESIEAKLNSEEIISFPPAPLKKSIFEEFDKIIPNTLPQKLNATSKKNPPAIFILAPPRSGTTLLRVMLAGHPKLFAANELQLLNFENMKERADSYSGKFGLWKEGLIRAFMELKNCNADEAKAQIAELEKEKKETKAIFKMLQDWIGRKTLVDKSPSYAIDKKVLEKAELDFENAIYLHLVRHPYSMVQSFEKYHLDQVLYLEDHSFQPKELGELIWIKSHQNILEFLEGIPQNRQFRMTYEGLVAEPESVMKAMCRQIKLRFHKNLLNPYQDLDKKMTDGIYENSRSMGDTNFEKQKNINAQKAEEWKAVFSDNFLQKESWDLINTFGYESINASKEEQSLIRKIKPTQDPEQLPSIFEEKFSTHQTRNEESEESTFEPSFLEKPNEDTQQQIIPIQKEKEDQNTVSDKSEIPVIKFEEVLNEKDVLEESSKTDIEEKEEENHSIGKIEFESEIDFEEIPSGSDNSNQPKSNNEIAIIGMSCRMPGAKNLDEFWQNLISGRDVSHQVTAQDLEEEGEDLSLLEHPNYVKRNMVMEDADCFDASFFGFHPKEASMMDPQHRIFLETAYEALENAGYNPSKFDGKIGIFGGVARNSYFTNNIATHKDKLESAAEYVDMLGSEKAFSITRVAYKLDLKGPAVNIQTACSSSGVAVHLACQSLENGDSDMVLVGGGRIQPPLKAGYFYKEGGPLSPDGYCRAFDANAQGMVQGNGMAMIVLKKLEKALEDGDHIWATIKSTAINNDGSDKIGFTAPSIKGQSAVIEAAHQKAGISAESISYVEAHGTGTLLGDPIEVRGLMDAFNKTTAAKQFCALGSVKTNIGHLDAGACIAGIIKTALALKHKQLPPIRNFQRANPQIDFENSPFYINASLKNWDAPKYPRRAGISSFGLGGTNAHIILEEAPQDIYEGFIIREFNKSWNLIPLSAKKEEGLEAISNKLKWHIDHNADHKLDEIAFTLANGRQHFKNRKAILADANNLAKEILGGKQKQFLLKGNSEYKSHPLIFMFPGGGAQYFQMAQDLYLENAFFQNEVNTCLEYLEEKHELGDLKKLIFKSEDQSEPENSTSLELPSNALPALFTVEYAMAKLWMHWGIQPKEMIGHSMGEYTAACLAGVMTLEEALSLVTVRGKLFETLPGEGGMLSVALSEPEVTDFMDNGLVVAVINKPDNCVVSGSVKSIDRLHDKLQKAGVEASKIHISVAAHSPAVEPILNEFKAFLESVDFKNPTIPFVSNVTGKWITDEEATSVEYWLKHIRHTVRFSDGLSTLFQKENRILLEVGPGQTLSSFARQHPQKNKNQLILASIRHPKESQNDVAFLYKTIGKLWVSGIDLDWNKFYENKKVQRVPLPTYPFEKKRFWIEPNRVSKDEILEKEEAIPSNKIEESPNFIENVPAPSIDPIQEESKIISASRIGILQDEIKSALHELSGLEPAEMDVSATFLELGFDSLFLSQAIIQFNNRFNLNISFRQLFEQTPSIETLADFVDEQLPKEQFQPTPIIASPTTEVENINNEIKQRENHTFEMPNPPSPPNIQNAPKNPRIVMQVIEEQLKVMQQQLHMLNQIPGVDTTSFKQIAAKIADVPKQEQKIIPSSKAPKNIVKRNTKGVTEKMGNYKNISSTNDLSPKQKEALERFILAYNERTKTSKEKASEHRKYYADPRSVTGFSKLWKEIVYQISAERSKGSKIWDLDGNEYIDFVMSYGVALFGHAPDFVQEAITSQIMKGNSLDVLPPEATEVAKIICELSGMDRATLANTGTEAVLATVRAARTYSGKERIAVFDTDYHGLIGQFMLRGVKFKDKIKALPAAPGIPKFLMENTLVLDYDDPDVLEKLAAELSDLAAVIIEPVQAQNPHWQHKSLIQEIRKMTAAADVALVFDEIINGFRLNQKGAQAWYGVEADLVAYGKSISGGLPLSAMAGKEKYMAAFDGGLWQFGDDSAPEGIVTYFAGTFIKNAVSVAAAAAALREIKRLGPSLQEDLNQKASEFGQRVREIFMRTKAPLMIQMTASFFMIKPIDANPLTRLFHYFLRHHGVNMRERPCFISTAHTDEDFEKAYLAIEKAIQDMFDGGFFQPWEGEDMNSVGSGQLSVDNLLQEKNNDSEELMEEILEEEEIKIEKQVPLTEGQVEIFISDHLSRGASAAFNIGTEIRLEGKIELEYLEKAIQELVDRHEALRTTFSKDGKEQIIAPHFSALISVIDMRGLKEKEQKKAIKSLYNEAAEWSFNLFSGPLSQFKIIQLKDDLNLVFINVHHIICDGWSLGILTRDLGKIYANLAENSTLNLPKPKQLSTYAKEYIQNQDSDIYKKTAQFWLDQYSDNVPILELPTDFQRPSFRSFKGGQERLTLSPEFSKELRSLAAKQGTTFYVFMMAAFQAYLNRISQQEDFAIGVAAAGHNMKGNQNLVGHCVNVLPLRAKIPSNIVFKDFLKGVRGNILDAFDNQNFTFGALVKKLKIARNLNRNTLLSVVFNMDSPLENLEFGKLQASTKAIPRHYETFDVFINLSPVKDYVNFEWNYNKDIFTKDSIQNRLAEFEIFLKGILKNIESPIAHLPILPKEQIKKLVKFAQGERAAFPTQKCLHQLFEQQVLLRPHKEALIFENQFLSYKEFNQKANRLAHFLLDQGMEPGDKVGIYLERSLDLVISIYAILKAGGTYVPVNISYPKERIQFILEDSESKFLLSNSKMIEKIPSEIACTLVNLDAIKDGLKKKTALNVHLDISSSALAYIIYTSGSTGNPKGVAVAHRSAINTIFGINRLLKIGEEDTLYSLSSMSFDMSIPDFFLPMGRGAKLVLANESTTKDGFALVEDLQKYQPTFMQATPTTYKILLLSEWLGSEKLTAIVGGEAFPKELAIELEKCCKSVWNGYGPTETTIYTTYKQANKSYLEKLENEYVAIGKPIANVDVCILDKNLEPMPIGVPGELFIAGPGVCSNYMNRPDLSQQVFCSLTNENNNALIQQLNMEVVDGPHFHLRKSPDQPIWYKTGDLVRYLPNGDIDFIGRVDNQVKIKGFRIELGEIESFISQYENIKQCAVKVMEEANNRKRLAAYLVTESNVNFDENGLKEFLSTKIPPYMIPTYFTILEEMPLNASLKIDRKALPAPNVESVHQSDNLAEAKTTTEQMLVEFWKEVLNLEKVGIHEDFFELGGHSLSAVELMAKIKKATEKKIPLSALILHSKISELAAYIDGSVQEGNVEWTSLIPIRKEGSKPPIFLVHGGGLHVLFYQALIKYLDKDQPVYALQAKGLNGKEQPLDRIEDMAAHYISEILQVCPNGPYNLAGYSLGGLIAYEMAQQLLEDGKVIGTLGLFDSVAKNEWAGSGASGKLKKKLKKAGYNLSLLFKDPKNAMKYKKQVLLVQWQHTMGKLHVPHGFGNEDPSKQEVTPYGKEVYEKSLEAYEKYELKKIDLAIDLFKAKEQMFYLNDPEYMGWKDLAMKGVRIHHIDGNHLTLFDDVNGEGVANALQECLDRVGK